jgi:hypothetical protein
MSARLSVFKSRCVSWSLIFNLLFTLIFSLLFSDITFIQGRKCQVHRILPIDKCDTIKEEKFMVEDIAWDVAPCSLIASIIRVMMEAVCTY